MRPFLFFVCLNLFFNVSFAQSFYQTIRGTVTDVSGLTPLKSATVTVLSQNSLLRAQTDSNGNFIIRHVPVGRVDIEITCIGFELKIIRELEVGSGKEVIVTAELSMQVQSLTEVKIKAGLAKERPLNPMSIAGGRMLTVEQAKRFAGGFDDPARLVSSFAGVAGNVANNGIVVRGNAPKSLQWKLEGIEIPNPNHFADLATFGGGGLTAMSSQLLANSDFLTGAFPAEYSNALSGIFDMQMRSGNNKKKEHTFQFGLTGIDFASEGPFNKQKKSSYLLNYRYSTLSLLGSVLPEGAGGTRYQDLSFKLNFPTQKSGVFSIWGIALHDKTGQKAKTDLTKWEFENDKTEQDGVLYMGAAGLSHKINLNKKSFLKSTLAFTTDGIDFKNSVMNNSVILQPDYHLKNKTSNLVLSSFLQTRFSAGHTNKTGISFTKFFYNLNMKEATAPGTQLQTLVLQNGSSELISGYSSSLVRFTDKLSMTLGLSGQLFTLNNNYSIEPRAALQWRPGKGQTFSFAYGKHSRLEKLFYYFIQPTAGGNSANKQLEFTKAHHWVAGYSKKITNNLHFKAELYYQRLYDVPVIKDSSFSLLNIQNSWFVFNPLVNEGMGKNYGIELTMEKYLTDGFYFLSAISVFDSKYKNGNSPYRNTRFNRNYVLNFLTGKEWKTGKANQHLFGINIRATYQGGDRYSPVDTQRSLANKEVFYDETNAFSRQYPSSFIGHLTINYKINRKKSTHELSLKLINATGYKERYGYGYNFKTNTIDEMREALIVPNLSYKIEF
jgi:Carboxypeptidase regulatory-like domain